MIDVDFGDADTLNNALKGSDFDRIVHLGAQPGVRYSLENPCAYVHSNLIGHLNVVELARHRGVRHLVYASSPSVYGLREEMPSFRGPRRHAHIALCRDQARR